jgi:hypothetical protein
MLHIKRSKTWSILMGNKLDDIGSPLKQVQGSLRHVRGTVWHVTGLSSHNTETYEVVTV